MLSFQFNMFYLNKVQASLENINNENKYKRSHLLLNFSQSS